MYIYQFSDKSNEMFCDEFEETVSHDAQIHVSDPDDLKLFKRYDKNADLNQTEWPILVMSTL